MMWAADTGLIYFQGLSCSITPISVLEYFILYRKDCADLSEENDLHR